MAGSDPQFDVGDQVLTPDDRLATVVYLAADGGVAVETPWSAQWQRFSPGALRLVVRDAE